MSNRQKQSQPEPRRNALVPYTSANLRVVAAQVDAGEYVPQVPNPNAMPDHLNDINVLGYSILASAHPFNLKPNEISFLGTMCGANFLTKKQRKWLRDLAMKWLEIDIDEQEEEGQPAPV